MPLDIQSIRLPVTVVGLKPLKRLRERKLAMSPSELHRGLAQPSVGCYPERRRSAGHHEHFGQINPTIERHIM